MPFEKRFDLDEYVTEAVSQFLDGEEASFASTVTRINDTADLLHGIEPNILRRYENGSFRRRTGRVAFETVFVGVAKNLERIHALPDAGKFILNKTTSMWSGGYLSDFVSAGVTGTSRIQKTIPFGAEWFDPNANPHS